MSTSSSRSAAQCRELIDDAGQAIGQLLQLLWQIPGNELGALLGQLDALAAAAAGARLAVTTEAQIRGEIADSQAPSVAGWAAQHATTLAATGSTTLARVMRETIGKPDLAAVHRAAVTGALTLPVAVTVLSEYAALRPLLHDEAAPTCSTPWSRWAPTAQAPGSADCGPHCWPPMAPTTPSNATTTAPTPTAPYPTPSATTPAPTPTT
jgi:hypothetical protein